MSLPESGLWETWKNGVASQHVANGVKGVWMIIWELADSQQYGNWMWVSTDLILKQFF